MNDTGPVIFNEAYRFIVVKEPLSCLCHFSSLDLLGLSFNSTNIDSSQVAYFVKDAPKNAKIVIVTEADHSANGVALALLSFMAVDIRKIDVLW